MDGKSRWSVKVDRDKHLEQIPGALGDPICNIAQERIWYLAPLENEPWGHFNLLLAKKFLLYKKGWPELLSHGLKFSCQENRETAEERNALWSTLFVKRNFLAERASVDLFFVWSFYNWSRVIWSSRELNLCTLDLSTIDLCDLWSFYSWSWRPLAFSTIDLVTLDLSTSDLMGSLSCRQLNFYISDLLTVDLFVSWSFGQLIFRQ